MSEVSSFCWAKKALILWRSSFFTSSGTSSEKWKQKYNLKQKWVNIVIVHLLHTWYYMLIKCHIRVTISRKISLQVSISCYTETSLLQFQVRLNCRMLLSVSTLETTLTFHSFLMPIIRNTSSRHLQQPCTSPSKT